MGGEVAMCIRRRGRGQTRMVPKFHACMPTGSDFLGKNPGADRGFAGDWKASISVPLAPRGYGLVVIDHKTRWVGSCNGYADIFEGMFRLSRPTQIQDLVDLCQQGRAKQMKVYVGGGQEATIGLDGTQVSELDTQTIIDAAGSVARKLGAHPDSASILADVAPPEGWVFESFDVDSPPDWTSFLDSLDERGLSPSTPQEIEAWDAFFLEYKEFDFSPADAWRARLLAKQMEQSTPSVHASTPSRRRGL